MTLPMMLQGFGCGLSKLAVFEFLQSTCKIELFALFDSPGPGSVWKSRGGGVMLM